MFVCLLKAYSPANRHKHIKVSLRGVLDRSLETVSRGDNVCLFIEGLEPCQPPQTHQSFPPWSTGSLPWNCKHGRQLGSSRYFVTLAVSCLLFIICHWINQMISQPSCQLIQHSQSLVSQPANEWMDEWMTDWMNEWIINQSFNKQLKST